MPIGVLATVCSHCPIPPCGDFFCFPLTVIMTYFVIPKSGCIKWEIGNMDTFMIFGNLLMCFGKSLSD